MLTLQIIDNKAILFKYIINHSAKICDYCTTNHEINYLAYQILDNILDKDTIYIELTDNNKIICLLTINLIKKNNKNQSLYYVSLLITKENCRLSYYTFIPLVVFYLKYLLEGQSNDAIFIFTTKENSLVKKFEELGLISLDVSMGDLLSDLEVLVFLEQRFQDNQYFVDPFTSKLVNRTATKDSKNSYNIFLCKPDYTKIQKNSIFTRIKEITSHIEILYNQEIEETIIPRNIFILADECRETFLLSHTTIPLITNILLEKKANKRLYYALLFHRMITSLLLIRNLTIYITTIRLLPKIQLINSDSIVLGSTHYGGKVKRALVGFSRTSKANCLLLDRYKRKRISENNNLYIVQKSTYKKMIFRQNNSIFIPSLTQDNKIPFKEFFLLLLQLQYSNIQDIPIIK